MRDYIMMRYVVGQAFGFTAIVFSFLIYQQKTRTSLLLFKLITDILWVLQFYFIGAYTGMLTTLLAVGREVVFFNKEKKWGRNKIWLLLFCLLFLSISLISWRNAFSILPPISSVIATIGFWCNKTKTTKILALPVSVMMLLYNLSCYSIAGIISELVTILSVLTALFKMNREKDQNKFYVDKWNN